MSNAVDSSGGLVTLLRRGPRLKAFGWLPMTADAGSWALGLTVATTIAAADPVAPVASWPLFGLAHAALAQTLIGIVVGLYRGRASIASFDELILLVTTVGAVAVIVALTGPSLGLALRPQIAIVGAAVALLVMMGARAAWRLRSERVVLARERSGQRTIVFGAGEGGYQIVRAMLRREDSTYNPVALLDDDRSKRYLRVMGIPVMGGREAIGEVARRMQAEILLVAIPSASRQVLQELSEPCATAGILGRPPSLRDPTPRASYVRGKKVLATGPGRYIGSELGSLLAPHRPGQH